jgi:hypothetical protein
MAKKISESRSDSRSRMRRPTLKWLEDTENYSGEPKVKKKSGKGNREEWSCHRRGQGPQRTMEPRRKNKHLVKMTL